MSRTTCCSRCCSWWFQSTSSEEDVVSPNEKQGGFDMIGFNPRPPKRTLCPQRVSPTPAQVNVSIHVLRRGRCVWFNLDQARLSWLVSIHVLRRGRCVIFDQYFATQGKLFQSTSSEEDVVSTNPPGRQYAFTSFNPRPPKRTLCPYKSITGALTAKVSIHVLRRGRCVLF